MEDQSTHTFCSRFFFQISVCQSPRSRIEKGLIDGDFYALKIIQCTPTAELYYRQLLIERQEVSRQLQTQNLFTPKVAVQTVVDLIDPVTRQTTIYLHIFSPYVPSNNLRKYASTSPLLSANPLSLEQKCERVGRVVEKAVVLLMRHSNQQLYSFNTFLFDEGQQELSLNITSFVGLQLMLYNEQISQQAFLQIYELLGSFTLKKPPQDRFCLQLKFRALGMLILNMVLEKPVRIRIEKQEWVQQQAFQGKSLSKYRKFTDRLPERFRSLLELQPLREKINKIGYKNGVKYLSFLEKVFVAQQNISCTQAINLVVPHYNKQSRPLKTPISSLEIASEMYKSNIGLHSNDIFELLGLKKKNEMKLYFISLLADEETRVEELLGYDNLDQYIFSPHNYNMHNRAIYRKILRIVRRITDGKTYPQAQRYCAQLFGEQGELDCREESSNMQELYNMGEISDRRGTMSRREIGVMNSREIREIMNSREIGGISKMAEIEGELGFQHFLKELSLNFGVHRTMLRAKRIIAWTPQTKAIQKYNKLFS